MASLRRKLAFTAALTAGALALAEGVARLVPVPTDDEHFQPGDLLCEGDACMEGAAALPQLPNGFRMAPSERYGWGFVPGSEELQGNVVVHINSLGLRGDEPRIPKPEGRLRLMTLGDSSIFGYGVEDDAVFSAVALRGLDDADLVHGAIPGHDTHQSVEVLAAVGPKVEPDVVAIGNLWSDLYQRPATDGPRFDFALYRHALHGLTPWLGPRTIGWVDSTTGAGVPGPRKLPRTGLGVYQVNLAYLAAEARRLGAEPVFVLLPSPWDVRGERTPDWVGAYRESMRVVADEQGAALVDGPALFADHPSGLDLFYDQVHPSVAGHRILGEALGEVLEAL